MLVEEALRRETTKLQAKEGPDSAPRASAEGRTAAARKGATEPGGGAAAETKSEPEAKPAEADAGSGSEGSPTKAAEETEAEVLASVAAMGFGVAAAKAALEACGGDAEGAVEQLLAQKDEEG